MVYISGDSARLDHVIPRMVAAEMLLILLSNPLMNFGYDDDKASEILRSLYEQGLHAEADAIAKLTVDRKNFGAIKVYNAFHQSSLLAIIVD